MFEAILHTEMLTQKQQIADLGPSESFKMFISERLVMFLVQYTKTMSRDINDKTRMITSNKAFL